MRYFLHLLFFLLFAFLTQPVLAQFDPLHPPNTFRSKDNPYYWKNRPPHEGYWQQDVHYKIKADVDERTNIIDATEELTYWNNSPDTLEFVYFHLYQNAFQPSSYYHNLQVNNDKAPIYGPYESKGLGTVVESLTVDGQELVGVLDNTVLKVYLNEPLLPNSSITFDIKFKTFFDVGSVRRRMKIFNAFGYTHFNGVHWYPRISVYDRKFGWTTDQHLGREFYGDFGTFDVELTFAHNYIVDATGYLQNRDEVLPPELREKLDIKNFKDKPWNEEPSVIIEYDTTQHKTWKFHAENVHDFAFTADPTYRIGEVEWNGIVCRSLVQEPHASRWQNAAEFTAKCIQLYSEDIGMYAYHKMIVADARDGMEYPMLTLDAGADPGYRGLLAHEVGHNWFFGMIGNNETYRAALDEGFTQYLTAHALRNIDGEYMITGEPKSRYKQRFKEPQLAVNSRVYDGYMYDATRGEDAALNTHSDAFNGALRHGGGYRHVYYKTATMLYNLEYVLGDELFQKALSHYFNQWKMCHPYFEDVRQSFIDYTKVDLNWFFDQWLTTTKTIDYAIKSVKRGEKEDEYIITFKRKGRMQMPIDFQVTSRDDEVYDFHIPNTWFVKQTDATILPKWYGWDKLQPIYKAKVTIPGGIQNVVIDPTDRLADVYMLDNSKKFPVDYQFDHQVYNRADWRKYELKSRPDLWYNAYDGLKLGVHANGHYMYHHHIFDATVWFNTGFGQYGLDSTVAINEFDDVSFLFNYKHNLDRITDNAYWNISARALDGLYMYSIGVDKSDHSEKNKFYINFKSMIRPDSSDLVYLLYPNQWNVNKFNNTVNTGVEHTYDYIAGKGNVRLDLKTTAIGSDYNYSQLSLSFINGSQLGKLLVRTRTFFQYGTGNNIAPESALYLASANPEEMMDNKYTRSQGIVPGELGGFGETTGNFHHGGGLNLRGYAGYLAPFENEDGEIVPTYKGNSGAAVNMELEFDRLLGLKPFLARSLEINTYLFGDAGIINANEPNDPISFANFRADAGVGATLTIRKWGPLETVKPLTLRFDVPFFLNRTPAVEQDNFQFRWLVGVNRAF